MRSIVLAPVLIISLALMNLQCEKEPDPNDPVDIPDQHFLAALIEDGVDTNGDGLISYGEAKMILTIVLDPDSTSRSKGKISSLEGIEAFINLDTLHCCYNQIQELDVSVNAELRVLVCWNGDVNDQLASLIVSKNRNLEIIDVPGNQLTELDVSNCPSLYKLWCSNNQITNLDVSKNTNLGQLFCCGNKLTSLDISKNINLGKGNEPGILSVSPGVTLCDMPTLTEVCVWTLPFPPTGFYGFEIVTSGSPNIFFTKDCSNQEMR